MYTLHPHISKDHDELMRIWESSVRTTHLFLSTEDVAFYKQMIIEHEAFDAVEITLAKNTEGDILGFMGVAEHKLEMIFLLPEAMGKGIGKLLMQHAIDEQKVNSVDVNEQNKHALEFYERFGFNVVSRSPLDGTGKPYPILHMQLK
jgi:putative acetyltransferase